MYVLMRLMAQVVRLKAELHCSHNLSSPDFVDGCLWTLNELSREIEKREKEAGNAQKIITEIT